MNLAKLLSFEKITIQCHDNPDDDSLACGFALYEYFKSKEKKVRLFYSGKEQLTKASLIEMIRLLHIPIEYEQAPKEIDGLLLTVACQYGVEGVTKVYAKQVAVIDNHIQEIKPPILHVIDSSLGSCSTLVWKLLNEVGFSMSIAVTTALYYGLYASTNGFAEARHPLDRDLRDVSHLQKRTLQILKNTSFSLLDLQQASAALQNLNYFAEGRFAIIPVRPYTPNLLGLISDLAMQVENVDIAVAFCEVMGGFRVSIRAAAREYKASEIAQWLTSKGLGTGGGSAESAGAFISFRKYVEQYPDTLPNDYVQKSIQQYLKAYTLIDTMDQSALNRLRSLPYKTFEKVPVRLGYVPCNEVSKASRIKLDIRMLEGDISIVSDAETYLMIGMSGEVYPIAKAKFQELYTLDSDPFDASFDYPPVVFNQTTEERISLIKLAKSCSSKSSLVKAYQISLPIKVFTKWDEDSYVTGEKGDWLIMRENDPTDLYIITKELFPKLYNQVK